MMTCLLISLIFQISINCKYVYLPNLYPVVVCDINSKKYIKIILLLCNTYTEKYRVYIYIYIYIYMRARKYKKLSINSTVPDEILQSSIDKQIDIV